MDASKDFLGRGFSFPPQIDPVTGRFKMVENEEDIRQAIYIIIKTRLNERAMLPDFGCEVYRYIFELPDASYEYSVCSSIEEALTDWEPRIRNVKVSLDKRELGNGTVYFNIDYYVRATNNPNNLVFPYYLEEGIGE